MEVKGGFDTFAFEEEIGEVFVLSTLLHSLRIINRTYNHRFKPVVLLILSSVFLTSRVGVREVTLTKVSIPIIIVVLHDSPLLSDITDREYSLSFFLSHGKLHVTLMPCTELPVWQQSRILNLFNCLKLEDFLELLILFSLLFL